MKSVAWIRILFVIAAIYEIGIGLAFLLAGSAIFTAAAIAPPNHWGYVQFPACLLVVFGLMFAAVAARPQRCAELILPGVGLKVSYVAVTSYYWLQEGIAPMWKPFAIIDLIFVIAFLAAWAALRAPKQAS
jgi:hypothetical protein